MILDKAHKQVVKQALVSYIDTLEFDKPDGSDRLLEQAHGILEGLELEDKRHKTIDIT